MSMVDIVQILRTTKKTSWVANRIYWVDSLLSAPLLQHSNFSKAICGWLMFSLIWIANGFRGRLDLMVATRERAIFRHSVEAYSHFCRIFAFAAQNYQQRNSTISASTMLNTFRLPLRILVPYSARRATQKSGLIWCAPFVSSVAGVIVKAKSLCVRARLRNQVYRSEPNGTFLAFSQFLS